MPFNYEYGLGGYGGQQKPPTYLNQPTIPGHGYAPGWPGQSVGAAPVLGGSPATPGGHGYAGTLPGTVGPYTPKQAVVGHGYAGTMPAPTGAPAQMDKGVPPGVSPQSWANPIWRWIWQQQNPGWNQYQSAQPATPGGHGYAGTLPGTVGGTYQGKQGPGGHGQPGVLPGQVGGGYVQKGPPPGVNPESWANPIFRRTWMQQNPMYGSTGINRPL